MARVELNLNISADIHQEAIQSAAQEHTKVRERLRRIKELQDSCSTQFLTVLGKLVSTVSTIDRYSVLKGVKCLNPINGLTLRSAMSDDANSATTYCFNWGDREKDGDPINVDEAHQQFLRVIEKLARSINAIEDLIKITDNQSGKAVERLKRMMVPDDPLPGDLKGLIILLSEMPHQFANMLPTLTAKFNEALRILEERMQKQSITLDAPQTDAIAELTTLIQDPINCVYQHRTIVPEEYLKNPPLPRIRFLIYFILSCVIGTLCWGISKYLPPSTPNRKAILQKDATQTGTQEKH